MFILVNNDESLKSPSRGLLESLFCCWRRRNGQNISRRSKSVQNGSAVDCTTSHTIGQATGLGLNAQNRFLLPQIRYIDQHSSFNKIF